MVEPLRDRVLEAMVEVAAGLTGIRSWGATYPNVPTADREYRELKSRTQFPHCSVLEGTGSTVAAKTVRSNVIGYRHEFKVLLVGAVSAANGVTVSRWLERYWDDLWTTFLQHYTLGGLVQAVQFDGELVPDVLVEGPTAEFVQPCTVFMNEEKEVAING